MRNSRGLFLVSLDLADFKLTYVIQTYDGGLAEFPQYESHGMILF